MTEDEFVLKLRIRRKPYGRPVYYKTEAERFTSDKTVKLNVRSRYLVELITSPPPHRLQSVFIADQKLDLIKETKKERTNDSNFRLYFAEWKTSNLVRNEPGNRTNIDLRIKVDGLEMRTKLQCKLYGEQESAHCCWGNAIDYFEYRCRPSATMTSSIDVTQETFVEL